MYCKTSMLQPVCLSGPVCLVNMTGYFQLTLHLLLTLAHIYVGYEERMTLLVCELKVKFTIDKYGNNLVNMIETKLLSVF